MADYVLCQARLPLQVTSLTGWATQAVAYEQCPQQWKYRHDRVSAGISHGHQAYPN